MGMVPYMHRGEAMPRRLAGITPSHPIFIFPIFANAPWMYFFPNTDTTLPSARQLVELCRLYSIRDVVAAFTERERRGRVLPLYRLAVSAGTFSNVMTTVRFCCR